jgi:hypothetical protein
VKKKEPKGVTATMAPCGRYPCPPAAASVAVPQAQRVATGLYYKRFPGAPLHSVHGLVRLPHRTASLPWAKA